MTMKRREFVLIPLAAMSAPLVRLLAAESIRLEPADDHVRIPLRFFTADEAKIVTAAAERIFPRDANGAGATDAAVTIYIDRQLAGPYGRDKYRYTKPPFGDSGPEHGYQGAANPRQIYRDGLRTLAGFAKLSEREQIAKLTSIERTPFFALLRAHTIEGRILRPDARRECELGRVEDGRLPRSSNELPRRHATRTMAKPFAQRPRASSRSRSTSPRRGRMSVSRQPATNLKPVDVAIIGGGWTGLMMAKEITTGHRLRRGLERGGRATPTTRDDGRARLHHPSTHDAKYGGGNHHPPAFARQRRSGAAVRVFPSRHRGRGRGRALGRRSFRFLPDVFTLRTHYSATRSRNFRGPLGSGLGGHLRRS